MVSNVDYALSMYFPCHVYLYLYCSPIFADMNFLHIFLFKIIDSFIHTPLTIFLICSKQKLAKAEQYLTVNWH